MSKSVSPTEIAGLVPCHHGIMVRNPTIGQPDNDDLGIAATYALELEELRENGAGKLTFNRRSVCLSLCLLLASCFLQPCSAQVLEPRRWTHLPIDTNFLGGGYAYDNSKISFDPVLRIEGAKREVHKWAARYIRTFELFDKSARFDVTQSWQEGRWDGLLNGVPTTVTRQGWSDTIARFAVNLIGAPPLKGKAFAEYRAKTDVETLVGAAVAIHLPTGQYKKDKLINLGSNRFTFRPQLGVVHNRGPWSFELTGSAWLFTDNNSFFNGNRLEQDPIYTIQGHVDHTHSTGLRLSLGGAYGIGGRSTVNGETKNDKKEQFAWKAGASFPVTPKINFRTTYVGYHKQSFVGTDSHIYGVGFSTFW